MERRNVRKVFWTVWIFVCLSLDAFAQSPYSKTVDGLIRECMDLNFACQFDSALARARTLEQLLPDESIGYVCRAGVLQSMMIDYATDGWKKEFFQNVNRAIRIGEKRIRERKEPAWNWYCLGSVYLYKGLYQGKTGSLVSGFINAHRGIGYLEKAYKADSTMVDALAGIGSYKYWAGRFYQHLRWLPWIRDERDLGIQMLETAIHRGTFSNYAGLNSLGWIEYDRNQCEYGLALFERGLEKYADSRLFLWGKADCLFRLGRMAEAGFAYERILDSILGDSIPNPINEAECRMKLALAGEAQADPDLALEQCNAILSIKTDSRTSKRIEKQRQKAIEIKQRILIQSEVSP
ncbi:MAG TPA: tetratricopeptide repeat protein [bacterium]